MITKTESNNWKISWQLLSVILAVSFGGVGFIATTALLRLPNNPSCNRISLFFSSATNRIYCAQLQAEKNTVDSLLEAITLVEALSPNHPLRNEINRHVEEWSNDILLLADKELNKGKLEEAIAIARKIPSEVKNYTAIEDKIAQWTEIWDQAEVIQEEVEAELRNSQWNKAFLVAVKFLNIDNDYWQNIKYQETVKTINLAREESKQLDGAYVTLRAGDIDSLLKTIETASVIPPSSYSYNEASKLIKEAEEKITAIVEKFVENQDWNNLSELTMKIPDNSNLKNQARDWNIIASAGKNANLGTVSGMELAIAEVEQIPSDSKFYNQSRELVQGWMTQKEDLTYLANARDLARSGQVGDLNAAIAKAELVNNENPLYREARQEIRQWKRDIQIQEDKPLLTKAEELARVNNLQGWQNAINQASQIKSDRALYTEASNLMREWRRNIERVEDQPVLDQAIALGNNNNYQEAVNIASRIGRGRALYSDAQNQIRRWRREINAQEDLQRAYQTAQNNDPQSLSSAISIARRIPSSSTVESQSRQAVNRWSEQLLIIARRVAGDYAPSSIEQAIRIAEMIPSSSSAYNQARQEIRSWKNELNPSINDNSPIQETNFYN
ncbi:chromosome segregation ATPases [Geminocystis sp. NIES-3708]|uniref:hypothetical protein n=1 Tax=Geminocystis sp. NIES-3708 TaxID=1615909 RepID=UPI0005FCCAF9|nr:hypothetical protein [Geminocystis sp. NIES-3708]BAQ61832.1 chromosome segregation ATPases [Geminocystis sp. NIES-3708]